MGLMFFPIMLNNIIHMRNNTFTLYNWYKGTHIFREINSENNETPIYWVHAATNWKEIDLGLLVFSIQIMRQKMLSDSDLHVF